MATTLAPDRQRLRMRIEPIDAPLGADVFDFPFADFTDAEWQAVHDAWLDRSVLRFRGIDIDDAQQIRFAARLGPFVIHPRQLQQGQHQGHKEILVISNARKEDGSAAGDLGDGEVKWHTDTWFKERPPSASILRALKLPAWGGDTQFLSMYAAYDTAPEALKRAVAGKFIHHQTVIDGRGEVRLGMTKPDTDDVRLWPGVDHPIVRTHGESGRKCFFLGGKRHASIIGMEPSESAALIEALWAHCEQDRFVWSQHWAPGDMVMWDNRCCMHRRDPFDPDTVRLMHRTATEGERPV